MSPLSRSLTVPQLGQIVSICPPLVATNIRPLWTQITRPSTRLPSCWLHRRQRQTIVALVHAVEVGTAAHRPETIGTIGPHQTVQRRPTMAVDAMRHRIVRLSVDMAPHAVGAILGPRVGVPLVQGAPHQMLGDHSSLLPVRPASVSTVRVNVATCLSSSAMRSAMLDAGVGHRAGSEP